MKTEKVKISFDVPLAEYKKTKNGFSGDVVENINWTMTQIRQTIKSHITDGFPHEDIDFFLEEYAKYWLYSKAGIETYPMLKKKTPAKESSSLQ